MWTRFFGSTSALVTKFKLGNRLVEFRIHHALQARPDFGLPVLGLPASRPVGLLGMTAHGDHLGAWTASGRWA